MRNLRNLGHWFHRFSDDSQAPCVCSWDPVANGLICAYGPSDSDSLVTLQRWSLGSNGVEGTSTLMTSWNAPHPAPDTPCGQILDIHYFPDNASTCLVFAGGDVVLVQETPLPGQEKIEIVGSVQSGISAAAWAPDAELLVILTNSGTVLFMSRDFEGIADITLSQDDLKASKHVSVGWGKAETQFRGKGAKALRDPTMPEKVDQGLKSPLDNGSATISWRGDGAFVAINSLQRSDRRVIRVYSREGELDGVTEPVDYLESALSWRPAGNLMAAIQRLDDRIDIVFFERNGLRHGQFSLRLSPEELKTEASVIDLKWNSDSTILAVCLTNSVQLWTMGNYHYYLKQEIRQSKSEPSTSRYLLSWHPEQALNFAIGYNGYVQRCEYAWHYANGTNIQPFDIGLTSVIDGRSLKITPLKLSTIPPPMSQLEFEISDNILDVAYFDTSASSPILIALLDNHTVSLYAWNPKEKPLAAPKLQMRRQIMDSELSLQLGNIYPRQLVFSDEDHIIVLADSDELPDSVTIELNLLESSPTHTTSKQLEAHVRGVLPLNSPNTAKAILWYSNNRIEEIITDHIPNGTHVNGSLNTQLDVPSNLQSLILQHRIQDTSFSNVMLSFGLRKNGMLFANRHCIAKDCTSFLVSEDHLIFTTSQHLLKFVHLAGASDLEHLSVPADTPEVDERCRAVERGAKLVNVIPSTSALVLQMPRGNLETIYPRALILPVIRRSINHGKYKKAFLACRNHRVDMNIIHDHNPEKFLQSVGLFIDQVRKVEHIDLFLSQLREEDVSLSMYKETSPGKQHSVIEQDIKLGPTSGHTTTGSKVNRICLAFLEALRSRRSTNLQNVITSYVCQNPPALEDGLSVIIGLRATSPQDVDRTVEHICFLADVNRLFDAALGMYDLDMTLLIAQQSQRDPREYLPFLQKLKELEPSKMKVDIDNHLRRYTKVLQHLRDLDDFEALKKHMIRYELYEQAIELFKYQQDQLKDIMQSYAEFLETKSRHKDAGIAYEFLKNYKSASESYRLAHMWREALFCATTIPLDQEQLQSFATAMADSLVELKDYQSAAIIHLDYLQNIETSTRLFCKGYHYAEATRLLGLHRRQDLLEKVLDVGLAEGQATITELLADMKSQLNAQVPRILELRVKKVEEPLAFYDTGATTGADVPDNVSLAGTDASTVGGTLFTRYTNRTGSVATNATRATSKKRAREERKRARGKKGSVYEEEYLINSVARLIERANAINDDVQRLITGLMRRGMRERARAVQQAMLDIVQLCKDSAEVVFTTKTPKETHPDPDADPVPKERHIGGEAVMWESIEQLSAPREAPPIKSFERLSILGV